MSVQESSAVAEIHQADLGSALLPGFEERQSLLDQATRIVNDYYRRLPDVRVTPDCSPERVRGYLDSFTFEEEFDAPRLVDEISGKLEQWGMQVAHPSYYGLFNPTPSFYGVIADLLVAAYNPQLGAWHHSPIGVAVEAHLIRYFANRFGLPESAYGHFTSGGSEANCAGVLIALTQQFPEFARAGVRGLSGQPTLYCSTEFHHSFEKIAHQCGLGRDAVRLVPVTDQYVMDVEQLDRMIQQDREQGLEPFMINATGGTTNAGLVEPLTEIAQVAKKHVLHLHVDAAWGGSVILSDQHKSLLAGIEHADTITFDPHKLLSVPMGAGMVICREHQWLYNTFGLQTDYVPESETEGYDNYRQSAQFSRRFIGLKLFMSLATIGRSKYAEVVDNQLAQAKSLGAKLESAGFKVENGAALGVVCFVPPESWSFSEHQQFEAFAQQACDSGEAWISATKLGGRSVLRACITSHLTGEQHLDSLVRLLIRLAD